MRLLLAAIALLILTTAMSAWYGGHAGGKPISCAAALMVGFVIVLAFVGAGWALMRWVG